MPSQVKEAEIETDRQLQRQDLSEDSATDYAATLTRLNDPNFLDQEGNEHLTIEDVEWGKRQALDNQRLAISGASDAFQDGVATGEIRSADDIDKKFGTGLPPRVIASFKASLADRNSEGYKARTSTPEYREAVIGSVELELQDLPLEMDEFPERLVQIEEKIHTLPAGPTKTRLKERVQAVRDGQIKEFDTAADIARNDLMGLYKENHFGDTEHKVNIAAVLDKGFLRNRKNLLADGYSQNQADTITGRAVDKVALKNIGYTENQIEKHIKAIESGSISNTKSAELYRAFRASRPNQSTLNGYQAEIADAVAAGETSFTRIDTDKLSPAQRGLSKAITELDQWLNANPARANDFEAIDKKKFEIIDKHITQGADSIFSNPSVLPPRSAAPRVAPFITE